MFFKKLKGALGIGAAKIDTVLDYAQVEQGGQLSGKVIINGGKIDQEANFIEIKLMTRKKAERERVEYEDEDHDGDYEVTTESETVFMDHCICNYRISDQFTIEAGEDYELEFNIDLHPETPITDLPIYNNACPVWIATEVDIDMALDPRDKDTISISPLPVVKRVIDCIEHNGFTMKKADVEEGFLRGLTESGCYQEIEFKGGGWNTQEIEISTVVTEEGVTVHLEKDRFFGGEHYFVCAFDFESSYEEIDAYLAEIL